MPATNLDQALRLDRQLDAMLAGIDPEEGQTHDAVVPTLHHLQQLFGRPLPDPAFTDRLGRELTTPAADVIPSSLARRASSGVTQITRVMPQSHTHSRWRRWDIAAALLVIAVLGSYLAVTSPDHPVPTPGPLAALTVQSELGIPDPAECQVEPRTIKQLDAIAHSVFSLPLPKRPVSTPLSALTGEPAYAARKAAVMRTERELVACLNAGNVLSAYALFTDGGLALLFSSDPIVGTMDPAFDFTPDFSDFGTPAPPLPDSQRLALLSVRDIRDLPDGRVAATVMISRARDRGWMMIPTGAPVVHIFQPGAPYLIDESIVRALGTPTP